MMVMSSAPKNKDKQSDRTINRRCQGRIGVGSKEAWVSSRSTSFDVPFSSAAESEVSAIVSLTRTV